MVDVDIAGGGELEERATVTDMLQVATQRTRAALTRMSARHVPREGFSSSSPIVLEQKGKKL